MMTNILRCAVPLLLLIGGCQAEQTASPAGTVDLPVIETYEIDDGSAQEVANTISVLIQDFDARARAVGQNLVAVSAPKSIQEGVASLIDHLADMPADTAVRVRLHYWLVAAQPSSANIIPDNLQILRAALTEATSTLGPMEYRRMDYIQQVLNSSRGNGVVHGDVMNVETSQAVMNNGRVGLDLMLRETKRIVGAYVDIDDGETILLAQMGLLDEEDELLMFLVRAELF